MPAVLHQELFHHPVCPAGEYRRNVTMTLFRFLDPLPAVSGSGNLTTTTSILFCLTCTKYVQSSEVNSLALSFATNEQFAL